MAILDDLLIFINAIDNINRNLSNKAVISFFKDAFIFTLSVKKIFSPSFHRIQQIEQKGMAIY